jgi:serine/threonine-protein kinase
MRTLGKYEVLEELGAGAMGKVFHGRDRVLQREVAIKTISTEDADIELKQRFYREARSCGRLSHPNIVTVFDLGEQQGTSYIAMEYLEGEDLRKFIDRKTFMPLEGKLQVMAEVVEGLAHAHDNRIVHRDIKPSNIFLLKSGRPKILDFGIARVFASQLTRVGNALGTPEYMAPEQIRGKETDVRSDIFSASVVFFELLAHEHPFGPADIPRRIIQEPPKSLRSLNPLIPEKLEQILNKAMAKDPAERYQTAAEFAKPLRKLSFEVLSSCGRLIDEALASRQRLVDSLAIISKVKDAPFVQKKLESEHVDVGIANKITPEMARSTNASLHYFSLSGLAKEMSHAAEVLEVIAAEHQQSVKEEKAATQTVVPREAKPDESKSTSDISPELLAVRRRIALLFDEDVDKCLAEIEILSPVLANDSVIDSYWVKALSLRNAQQGATAAAKAQVPVPNVPEPATRPSNPPEASPIKLNEPTVLANSAREAEAVAEAKAAPPALRKTPDIRLIGGIATAVLVLILMVFAFRGGSRPPAQQATAEPAKPSATPQVSAPVTVPAPEPSPAAAALPVETPPKQPEVRDAPPARSTPAAPAQRAREQSQPDLSKDLAAAQSAFNEGNYDTAIALCDKILRAQRTNKQALELKQRATNAKAFEERFK